jgi:alpha-beta hydrolase superfamily lysophospholipase
MRVEYPGGSAGWRIARAAAASLGVAAGTSTLGLLGSAWYISNELLEPDRAGDPYSLRVLALDPFAVTLPATGETLEPASATLEWPGGYGLLGPVVATTELGARRALTERTGQELAVGTRTRLAHHAVNGTPAKAFGLGYEDIEVRTELGPMPAWLVPGAPGNPGAWAIAVHGRGHGRPPMLRVLPELHRAGLTTLVITYRNDVGAPASPDGLCHLGDTEWLDVEAAVREARRRGADRIVLVADSMGGAIVLQFLQRSGLTRGVTGVVLDSPVLDWNATLALAARNRHVPWLLGTVTKEVARRRVGLDWELFDQVARSDHLSVPMLIFHGEADTTVPLGPSVALAERRPDLVTLVRVAGAEHLDAWKLDPERCAAALAGFLSGPVSGRASGPAGGPSQTGQPGAH